nr:hypothetical protein [Candidatus Freyarchaeota archaeon]
MVWLDRKGQHITIEMPEEWGGIVPSEIFFEEGKRLVDLANERKLTIRLLGGVAIRLHTKNVEGFAKKLGRLGVEGGQEFTDLDFMAYKKQRDKIKEFLTSIGYIKRVTTISSAVSERQIYYHPKGWFHVDVFYDKLKMNHDIDFRKRLEIDYPTISVTDMLLEKMQIVKIAEKDIKDTCVLIRAHEVGEKEEECINAKYIAQLLSNDWGFWYTVTTNLKGVKELAPDYGVEGQDLKDITSKIDKILEYIDAEKKGMKWKSRSIVGSKKAWYRPVETTETVGDFGIDTLRKQVKEQK